MIDHEADPIRFGRRCLGASAFTATTAAAPWRAREARPLRIHVCARAEIHDGPGERVPVETREHDTDTRTAACCWTRWERDEHGRYGVIAGDGRGRTREHRQNEALVNVGFRRGG